LGDGGLAILLLATAATVIFIIFLRIAHQAKFGESSGFRALQDDVSGLSGVSTSSDRAKSFLTEIELDQKKQ
jgi:hypothetical protein